MANSNLDMQKTTQTTADKVGADLQALQHKLQHVPMALEYTKKSCLHAADLNDHNDVNLLYKRIISATQS